MITIEASPLFDSSYSEAVEFLERRSFPKKELALIGLDLLGCFRKRCPFKLPVASAFIGNGELRGALAPLKINLPLIKGKGIQGIGLPLSKGGDIGVGVKESFPASSFP